MFKALRKAKRFFFIYKEEGILEVQRLQTYKNKQNERRNNRKSTTNCILMGGSKHSPKDFCLILWQNHRKIYVRIHFKVSQRITEMETQTWCEWGPRLGSDPYIVNQFRTSHSWLTWPWADHWHSIHAGIWPAHSHASHEQDAIRIPRRGKYCLIFIIYFSTVGGW